MNKLFHDFYLFQCLLYLKWIHMYLFESERAILVIFDMINTSKTALTDNFNNLVMLHHV